MRTIRGPNDNHPAVRYDRVQRLVAAALKRRVVIAFALTALALRLATLTWGAGLGPYDGMYYPDEWGVWGSAQNFPGNYLTNQSFLHGTALQYVVGALLIPIKAWWEAGEPLIHGMNYAQFVLLSVRMAHVLLGALAVLLVYRLGKMLFDRATGLLAGALVAVSFYHVLTSAFTTLDVPASFFVLLTIILGARAARSGRWRDFAWLGVSAGLLLATRITVALAFVPVAVVLAFQLALPRTGDVAPRSGEPSDEESAPPPGRGVLLLGAGVAAAAALLVFVVAMPHVILYPRGFLSAVSGQAAGAASSIAT
ncbi:MAG TPA: glycosyltransferase family 39 protein, partial [Gemmatimonadaceae bacterium]|nr:glycosyltransferase family 39 protein [Gemmatimonadaceae bacterium]